ncbi:hypothetical protein SCP_1700660 [Sparassis crispa]|uniref:CxC2-like cysteine cluster KDZ transposase-associated domain-containing protein n=1 Tax=Sparassis crispa TaxID=139825 RepID=A0A401H5S2_9APHY|nr:hypothetical protein SCP_1700660 [Sparassis crispa]GBE89741.1 hypothetical protein SCP_1700660 [Sparassis crispa]
MMHRPTAKAKGITFQSPRRKVALVSKKMGLDSDGRHFLSGTGIVFNSGTPPKKRKLLSIDDESLPEVGPSSALTDGPDVTINDIASAEAEAMEDRVKNGVSRVFAGWKPHFRDLLAVLLATEAHVNIPSLCSAALCAECIMNGHHHDPFHWIDVWNGEFFDKVDLLTLGYRLCLGHYGACCPYVVDHVSPSKLVVTHTNGVHEVRTHWCHCPGAPGRVFQMLHAGLFPVTLDHLESAFTVPLLKEWHMHALMLKKGAYDYIYALRRLSNNSAPQTVKNRYREFNIISRIWHHLTMMKCAGNFHGLVLPNRDPQSLTVPCFTCPWPGMNMPRDWKDTPASLAYIHACELGGDGNHGLQKKRKHDDPNDISLGLGQGYFVHPDKMTQYMESIEAEPAMRQPVCSMVRSLTRKTAGNM